MSTCIRVAAIIKSAHPNCGPSEIKSALMTSSTMHKLYDARNATFLRSPLIFDEATDKIATPFDIGVGHIKAERASDPGLAFDLGFQEYMKFLCQLNELHQ